MLHNRRECRMYLSSAKSQAKHSNNTKSKKNKNKHKTKIPRRNGCIHQERKKYVRPELHSTLVEAQIALRRNFVPVPAVQSLIGRGEGGANAPAHNMPQRVPSPRPMFNADLSGYFPREQTREQTLELDVD